MNNGVKSTTGYATDLMVSESVGLHLADSANGSEEVPKNLTVK